VNGIAGYSAFWITGETEYYRHTGSLQQLKSVHERLVQLLRYMELELDNRKLYANTTHASPYVDWSPDFDGDTPESRMGTHFEFYAGFRDGIYLLRQLHDTQNADAFQKSADEMKAAAQKYLLDAFGSFGTRWQTNAYAVLSDLASPSQRGAGACAPWAGLRVIPAASRACVVRRRDRDVPACGVFSRHPP
jgi:hypothetical protein